MKEFQHREPAMSEREIKRNYEKLTIKPAEPNRINCYTCSTCDYITKTIDIHEGVTPMFNICPCCGKRSTSSWYKDIAPDIPVEYEWRVPTLEEMYKFKRNPAMLDHIFRGGLEMRRVQK